MKWGYELSACICNNSAMCEALVELMAYHWQGAAGSHKRQDEILESLGGAVTLLSVSIKDGKACFGIDTENMPTKTEDEADPDTWPRLKVCAYCYRTMLQAPLRPRPDLISATTFKPPVLTVLGRVREFAARCVQSICAR